MLLLADVLQLCCCVLRCVAWCCRVLHRVAVCCCALQCVAVCCSVLQGDLFGGACEALQMCLS